METPLSWLENSDEARHFRLLWDNDLPIGRDDVASLLAAYRGSDRWIVRDGTEANEPRRMSKIIACWMPNGYREIISVRGGILSRRNFTHWMPLPEPPDSDEIAAAIREGREQ
jgi:hypothetical protein